MQRRIEYSKILLSRCWCALPYQIRYCTVIKPICIHCVNCVDITIKLTHGKISICKIHRKSEPWNVSSGNFNRTELHKILELCWNSTSLTKHDQKSCQFLFIYRLCVFLFGFCERNGSQAISIDHFGDIIVTHAYTKCTQTNLLFLLSLAVLGARARLAHLFFYNFILHTLLTFMMSNIFDVYILNLSHNNCNNLHTHLQENDISWMEFHKPNYETISEKLVEKKNAWNSLIFKKKCRKWADKCAQRPSHKFLRWWNHSERFFAAYVYAKWK